MHRCVLRLSTLRYVVESVDAEVIGRIRELYGECISNEAPDQFIRVTISPLVPTALRGYRYRSSFDDVPLLDTSTWAEHERSLTRILNRSVLDGEPGHLHLHTAAVAIDGGAVLIVAPSGSGKSTLVAQLVADGGGYLTDEQLALDPTNSHAIPYPRPLTIRRRSREFFHELLTAAELECPDDEIEVPPARFGAAHHGGPLPVRLIIHPRIRAASSERMSIAPLTMADSIQVLVGETLDLGRMGVAGMSQLVDITCAAPAYALEVGIPASASATIRRLAADARATRTRRVVYRPPMATDQLPAGGPRPADQVHTWEFEDGTAVLFDPVAGRLLALNPGWLAVWRSISGSGGDVAAAVPTRMECLEHLAAAGFVVG